ncbi:MAG TPA: TIGR04282 family arsenosugar biosynthesis glycosyltransferase [Balneolaceae bacterium]
MQQLLIVFIKNPIKGRVKTRLAESIGDERALQVYRELLEVTKSVSDQLNCHRQVWYSHFIDDDDLWTDDGYEKRLQEGGDLGERMKNSFRKAFDEGASKVVIIGSDCPGLTSEVIKQAYDALDNDDLVIGPSKDGGYYLLGMNTFHPELFDDKPWSSSQVLNQTIKQAKKQELSFKLLTELNDIDTKEDLDKFREMYQE